MVYFITSNQHKFEEIQKMTSIDIRRKRIDYPEIQADSLEEVARYGIEYCYSKVREPCFVEDSGLFIDCLSGFPGVYSKYVFTTLGCCGILKLLENERGAHFRSVIAFKDERKMSLFTGDVTGTIAEIERGVHGFGFDPIFIPEGEERTFAEMTVEEKNLYSHRGKAFKMIVAYLEQVR